MTRFGSEQIGNGIGTGEDASVLAKSADSGGNGFGVEALVIGELACTVDPAEENSVAEGQGLRESVLKNATAHRIGARFQDGPETAAGPSEAGGFDRGADGRGVMREIVNDEDAVGFTFDVHAAANAAKRFESFLERRNGDAAALADNECSKCIQDIVMARNGEVEFAKECAFVSDAEGHAVSVGFNLSGDPLVACFEAVSANGTEGFFGGLVQRFSGSTVTPDHDATASRDKIHETAEGELIGFEVSVDIGVIIFEGGEDEVVGMVVEEFRGLVPVGGIVFIALEDKFLAAGEAIALAKILGDAADEEIRLFPGHMKNPGEHGGGGGFAVSAADDDRVPSRQEFFFEDFGKGAIRQLAIENFLHLDIAAGNGVADNNEIRRRSQMRGIEHAGIRDAQGFKERRSGRIDAGVGTGDAIATLAQHSRKRSHRRAADADHVDVLHRFPFRQRTA